MGQFLSTLLRLSLLGSLLAVLLLLLRPLLRRWTSRAVSYYLWLPVLLRLCIPLGITLSLPAVSPVPEPPAVPAAPVISSQSGGAVSRPAPAETEKHPFTVPTAPVPVSPPQPPEAPEAPGWAELVDWSIPLAALWAAGALTCLGWYAGGYLRFARRVRQSALPPSSKALEVLRALDPAGRVTLAQCPLASTPMLLGALRPAIILPMGVEGEERLRDILSHELTHARRHDLLYKWFAALATSLHWFNPVMLLVRREIARACELSCDEAVVRRMDGVARRHYGETLLALAAAPAHGPGVLAATLCEEKAHLKERLIAIVNYHTKGTAAAVLAALLVLAVSGCALVSAAKISQPEGSAKPPVPVVTPSDSQGGINPSQPSPGTPSDAQDGANPPVFDFLPGDFQSILLGQAGFIHVTEEGYRWDRDIHSVSGVFPSDDGDNQVWAFALADLDGDGAEELILHIIAAAGDKGGFEILRRGEDGQIYGYPTHHKAISELKTDGSFTWTSLTGNEWGAGHLVFTETGYEVHDFFSGSQTPGGDTAWYVDGQSVREEDYRAAADTQAAKPDAVWYELPLSGGEAHSTMATLRNLNLDGDGLADTVTAFSDWDDETDAAGSTTLRVTLGSGAVLEKTWNEGALLSLLAGFLTAPDRDAVVLERENRTSNYGAAEYHVLEVADGRLSESLTLDYARQEELGLCLVSGGKVLLGTTGQAGERHDILRLPSLVDKWAGYQYYSFTGSEAGWGCARDTYRVFETDITVTGGRQLRLHMEGPVFDASQNRPFTLVQVWDGDTLLQTITTEDVVQDDSYLFEGFLASSATPWPMDVNFDGADDLGLMCGASYNGPFCWFLWDDGAQQFRFGFFSSCNLTADWERRQLIDMWRDGYARTESYIYEYNSQGERVLVHHFSESIAPG